MSAPSPNQQGHRPTSSEYEYAVRGQGYTVPYQSPPPAPPPPRGVLRRVRQYNDLRRKAQASSMAWWGSKALQGCLLSIIPLLIGSVLTSAYVLFGGGIGGAVLGVLLLVSGLGVLIWYALAPWTCKWIVTVSENGYWVVEDGNGRTAEYLPPGRMIVPFRMNSKVHKYVTFQTVSVRETYEDVLAGTGQQVSMEIKVSMVFDPVNADSRLYARLRTMTQADQFENLVRNHVHDAVRRYFTLLAPRYWENVLQHPKVLEDIISEQLLELESMGLFLGSGQPVTVFVRGITISSGALPLPPDPERSRRDPLDLTPPPQPAPRKPPPMAQPARGDERRQSQPAPRRTAAPLPEQEIDSPPTMPHLHGAGGGHQQDDTPPFLPGTFDVYLSELDKASPPPESERRARRANGPRPRSRPPNFWIRGRSDQDES